ncbi:MAG: hypothetical protein IKN67_04980 [Alphaproteobacteria bacterium]|nr:hypothetical protein [Alphaproteobacteria bacterium]
MPQIKLNVNNENLKFFYLKNVGNNVKITMFLNMFNMNNSDEKVFSREERSEIAAKFRDEIKHHGVVNAILSVLDSTSDKVAVKRQVLEQQCRKKSFAKDFADACDRLIASYPKRKLEIREFKAAFVAVS